jgi:L-aspartate oxidase
VNQRERVEFARREFFVHVFGANRLASNSLLEGLVFGARAGEAAWEDSNKVPTPVTIPTVPADESSAPTGEYGISTAVRKRVKRVMWERVGILRDKGSLKKAIREFEQIEASKLSTSSRNFVTLALLVARSALWREESRGGHFRSDFPEQRDQFLAHSIQKRGNAIGSSKSMDF